MFPLTDYFHYPILFSPAYYTMVLQGNIYIIRKFPLSEFPITEFYCIMVILTWYSFVYNYMDIELTEKKRNILKIIYMNVKICIAQ